MKINPFVKKFFQPFLLIGLVSCYLPYSQAANTGGVHGPNVNPNDTSTELRIALAPADNDSQVDNWAYRYHIQHALNDKIRVRMTTQFRDRGDFEYDYLRAELLYNFKKAVNSNWSSGVRFDIRTRRGSRAEDITVHWTNQWNLPDGYRLRALVIANQQIGANRSSNDLGISTRAGISKKISGGLRVGVELFNSYGRLGNFGSFDDQNHQFGPTLAGSFGGLKYHLRWLRGISDGARDNDFELRLTKSF